MDERRMSGIAQTHTAPARRPYDVFAYQVVRQRQGLVARCRATLYCRTQSHVTGRSRNTVCGSLLSDSVCECTALQDFREFLMKNTSVDELRQLNLLGVQFALCEAI